MTAVAIPVLANDHDPADQHLRLTAATPGRHGKVTFKPNGTLI